jgi:hypothetical protein
MKLPFTFSFASLLRLFLPGLILGGALYPWAISLLYAANIHVADEYLMSALVLFSGWLTTLLDMHIYMFFEGRRFWPKSLWSRALRFEQTRLRHLEEKEREARNAFNASADPDQGRAYHEASIEIRRFPIDPETGEPKALCPTRLGNLLSSFEGYSSLIYGLDAAFSWPRIWMQLDKDLRSEIDNRQALADSGLYVSFALIASAISLLMLPIMYLFVEKTAVKFSTSMMMGFALMSAGLSYMVYRMSMHAHAQFGETWKAVFDVYHEKARINIEKEVIDWTGVNIFERKSGREQNDIVRNFLQNYAIYDEKRNRWFTPPEYKRTMNAGVRESPTTTLANASESRTS